MPVTPDDVRHIAQLARLAVDDQRIPTLVRELNGILEHMDALAQVDTASVDPTSGVGDAGLTLREDVGPPLPLFRPLEGFAPAMRDGFLLVPRLATHVGDEDELG
ncbi:MAG TPA: Asp-tRNA(Asn)/Glu-tRNA(Gln) amidotransferase subunit GatC [Gemmatimonadaceae bacterium]|nr:Asp-tRNA(Asn)/Glu-tRNA(Gln) amidotransferase subunit GatC [Gemmatimonadaceae bacterium]